MVNSRRGRGLTLGFAMEDARCELNAKPHVIQIGSTKRMGSALSATCGSGRTLIRGQDSGSALWRRATQTGRTRRVASVLSAIASSSARFARAHLALQPYVCASTSTVRSRLAVFASTAMPLRREQRSGRPTLTTVRGFAPSRPVTPTVRTRPRVSAFPAMSSFSAVSVALDRGTTTVSTAPMPKPPMHVSSRSSKGSVHYADAVHLRPAEPDSTMTTTIALGGFELCSVPAATPASDSSMTVWSGFDRPLTIWRSTPSEFGGNR